MTKKEAIKQLKERQQSDDKEVAHAEADDILCDLLDSMGYKDVVKEFRKIPKWYA